jgi:hypothetical protein
MSRPRANRRKGDPRAAKRDSLDFRDWIYEPALVPLAESRLPKKSWIEVLDQGTEGACTGFGLAGVINYLIRARGGTKVERVSARMLYEMAKHHDRWPGESYEGSSARGAMKGWYKNGVCLETFWPYDADDPGELTLEARESALQYPLGAFYRILPRRADMHAALQEVQVIFATAATHKGWDEPVDGLIEYDPKWEEQGGHAFAIVGYTDEGFLIQNSWDEDWGGVEFDDGTRYPGCAIWQYGDFDRNLWDAWVARLGRPFESIEALRRSTDRREEYTRGTAPVEKPPPWATISDHYIHIDDGGFDPHGDYYSTEPETKGMLKRAVRGGAKHIVFYAHGGLNSVKDSARRVAKWRTVFDKNDVHEIHFIWETGLLAELRDILLGKQDFVEGRAGGFGDWWDSWIERFTGPLGRGLWTEMRSDADIAFAGPRNAGTIVLETLKQELMSVPEGRRPKLHLVGHSAGSILFGHLLARLQSLGSGGTNDVLSFENLVLFAPACTHRFFQRSIKPTLASRLVGSLTHLHLDDKTERDDNVAQVYRKSLLYLVSRSYQQKGRVVPLMGMAKHLKQLPVQGVANRVRSYNNSDHPDWTESRTHGGFDNDERSMNNMLRVVLGRKPKRKFSKEDLSGY